jgi:hypothetical protein
LAFSYWIDNLGFITKGKLAAIFIKSSLGVSNWPVIYFINYTPTSFLAPSSPRHQGVYAVAASAARVFAVEENGFRTELASPRGICWGRMGRSSGA